MSPIPLPLCWALNVNYLSIWRYNWKQNQSLIEIMSEIIRQLLGQKPILMLNVFDFCAIIQNN